MVVDEVDGRSDYGRDLNVDLTRDLEAPGGIIGVQLKGGASYFKHSEWVIPAAPTDWEYWRSSTVPIIGMIHDPASDTIRWRNLTRLARSRVMLEDSYSPPATVSLVTTGYPRRRRVVSVLGAAGGRCFTAVMPRDNPATALATCAGCATSWRGIERAHCQACHATFDDETLFDAHRLTGMCVSPDRLDLVIVGLVWCRLLAGHETMACSVRLRGRRMA